MYHAKEELHSRLRTCLDKFSIRLSNNNDLSNGQYRTLSLSVHRLAVHPPE